MFNLFHHILKEFLILSLSLYSYTACALERQREGEERKKERREGEKKSLHLCKIPVSSLGNLVPS